MVTVGRSGANHRQQQEIQVPLQRFLPHASRSYASLYEVCKKKVHFSAVANGSETGNYRTPNKWTREGGNR
jgi:hypothetical protein